MINNQKSTTTPQGAMMATTMISKPSYNNIDATSSLVCTTSFEEDFFNSIPQLKVLPLDDSCSCSNCSQELSASLRSALDDMMHQPSSQPMNQCSDASTAATSEQQPRPSSPTLYTSITGMDEEEDQYSSETVKLTEQAPVLSQTTRGRHRRERNQALGQDDFDVLVLQYVAW